MAFFFNKHPLIRYDLENTGIPKVIRNPLVRFKLREIWKDKTALYYTHDIQDGQSAQYIADRYYNDITLDWTIYIINDIIDPQYDWPLEQNDFTNFVRAKYGSIEAALGETHHYEWIYQKENKLYDGTNIPEKKIIVDAATYAGLPIDDKREVDNYTYEDELNNSKRTIKIMTNEYLPQFLAEAEGIFE